MLPSRYYDVPYSVIPDLEQKLRYMREHEWKLSLCDLRTLFEQLFQISPTKNALEICDFIIPMVTQIWRDSDGIPSKEREGTNLALIFKIIVMDCVPLKVLDLALTPKFLEKLPLYAPVDLKSQYIVKKAIQYNVLKTVLLWPEVPPEFLVNIFPPLFEANL